MRGQELAECLIKRSKIQYKWREKKRQLDPNNKKIDFVCISSLKKGIQMIIKNPK
jgi:hypothetical protein